MSIARRIKMSVENRYCAMDSTLEGMDEMQNIIQQFPEKLPKSDCEKLMLWTAKQFYTIYRILFYILTRLKQ